MSSGVHSLFVTWQAPESRRFFPIARVMRRPSGEYEWVYVQAVSEAQRHGFAGLPGYEDLDRVVRTPEPPGVFAHRVPTRGRRRPASVGQASVPPPANDSFDPAPITLLVPLGAGRYERLEVFAPPLPGAGGHYWGVFAARGVGRLPGSEAAVAGLERHQPLRVRAEPDNPVSPRALLLSNVEGVPIGYVPDYLANELAAVLEAPAGGERAAGLDALSVEVLGAERVNHPPAEPVFSVLCQYTCTAELGARLFRSASYQDRTLAK
jgi:hypothetical protein